MAQHAQLRVRDRAAGLLLRPAQPVAAWQQREHQRAAAPVLPQGHRPGPSRRRGPRCGRRRAQQPASQDAGLENPGRSAQRVPVNDELTPARRQGTGPARRRARGYRRSGPPSGEPARRQPRRHHTNQATPARHQLTAREGGHFTPSQWGPSEGITLSTYDPTNQPVLRGPVEPKRYTAVLFTKRCVKAGIEV